MQTRRTIMDPLQLPTSCDIVSFNKYNMCFRNDTSYITRILLLSHPTRCLLCSTWCRVDECESLSHRLTYWFSVLAHICCPYWLEEMSTAVSPLWSLEISQNNDQLILNLRFSGSSEFSPSFLRPPAWFTTGSGSTHHYVTFFQLLLVYIGIFRQFTLCFKVK